MGVRKFLIGKLHRATVTEADLDYMGSITLDPLLIEAAGFGPLEEVDIWDVTNGARFSTYCLPGKRGGGDVRINGAAAHLAHVGDKIIVAAYGWFDEQHFGPHTVPVVIPDDQNRVSRVMRYEANLATGAFEIIED
jgi:aspartate 1-decarboxylase